MAELPHRKYARPNDVKRLIDTARECGITVRSVMIGSDGSIAVGETSTHAGLPESDFDKWDRAGRL